jgi:hypothetical protein
MRWSSWKRPKAIRAMVKLEPASGATSTSSRVRNLPTPSKQEAREVLAEKLRAVNSYVAFNERRFEHINVEMKKISLEGLCTLTGYCARVSVQTTPGIVGFCSQRFMASMTP